MSLPLLTLEVRQEADVILARQRARQIAGLVNFSLLDQTRIATAVSEIARNAYQHAGGGRVEFHVKPEPSTELFIRVLERTTGIKNLQAIIESPYEPPIPSDLGILGAKRLMDHFEIATTEGGTVVTMSKRLSNRPKTFTSKDLARVAEGLARHSPLGLMEELQLQNQELLRTLQELRERQAELAEMHTRELEETNRGVVALYSELDENAKQLRRISDLKSRFLSNMSHEFRSPLNTILSMSSFLLDGSSGELTAEQTKEIGFIRKAAQDLSALVNDLLDLAKVEAGKAVVRVASFQAADLLDTLRETTKPLLVDSSVTLVVADAFALGTLKTDEGKVAQILRNFLSNAAKFTEKGEIRLAAKAGPDDTLHFSVSDTGIGISLEDQRRVFEEFSQIEGPLQNRVKGTGLGLPLSRKLAELLGGTVSVVSEPGHGSTFFAVIPRVYRAPEERDPQPEARWQLDPLRSPVLVVEDDPTDLLIYEKFLEGSGFQVLPARTLEEARRLLRRVRPLAVLLDIILDAENGWTLFEEMKAQAHTRDIPILVLTLIDGQETAHALKATDFCIKPISQEWLLGRLNALAESGPLNTILIIDDEAADRYLLRSLLIAQGRYAVTEASSGKEGLNRARDERPDVIFLDMVLADATGFEILNQLKSEPDTQKIPVIISTSAKLSETDRERLSSEAAAILSKSIGTPEEAFAAIRDALVHAGLSPSPSVTEL